jgi:hypothetical protein
MSAFSACSRGKTRRGPKNVFPNIVRIFAQTAILMEQASTEIISSRWRILSGSWLKVMAVTIMLIDHLDAFIWYRHPAFQEVLFTIGSREITLYVLLRWLGRLAFPIFAFLIMEGFQHTRSRVRYGRNLLLFAFLSEIPWNLVHSGTWHYSSQNVFFTLFLGYLGLCAIEHFKDNKKSLLWSLLGLLVLSVLLHADYGCSGYGFILLLYVLKDHNILQAIIGSCVLRGRWIAGLAFIPINLYNGKRGFIRGSVAKYLFYLFYPIHLLVLYWIQIHS